MIPGILELPFIHVSQIEPGFDLIRAIRDLNDTGVEIPWAWCVSAGSIDPKSRDRQSLTIGIHNTVGALLWSPGRGRMVPSNGENSDWATYYLAGMHDASIPPHAEVPVEMAYQALTEFLATHAEPTCVTWQPAAEFS